MNEQKMIKKRQRHHERVTLTVESLKKIETWIDQLTSKNKGIYLKKADLVNWLIESRPQELTPFEMKTLHDQFFNEMKFLESAMVDLKKAKMSGEKFDLWKIINACRTEVHVPRTKIKKNLELPTTISHVEVEK